MSEFAARDDPSGEVEDLIPEGDVQGLQVLSAALLAGAVLFGFVVVGMHLGGVFPAPAAGPGAEAVDLIALLSLVHASVFVLWGLAAFPTRDRLIGRFLGALASASAPA